jgi:hypothetical protein
MKRTASPVTSALRLRHGIAGCCLAGLFACAESPSAPPVDAPELAITGVDPAPAEPGIFLGSDVTNTACRGDEADGDNDGLLNRCETSLAAAFAPELDYSSTDDVRRQPRWAARPLGSGRVRLAYLLSLYRDLGTQGCPFGIVACGGHYGDSEILVLDVYYQGVTGHWLLDQAIYSAHGVYNVYPRLLAAYPSMNFPGRPGGYPRAFLSLRKHAGYRSDRECDAGELGLDECTADVRLRVAAGAGLDLGSRGVHTPAQDCIAGNTPATAARSECYWTERAFGGWQGRTPTGSAYSSILSVFGF